MSAHVRALSVPGDRFTCEEGIAKREEYIREVLKRVGAPVRSTDFQAYGATGRNLVTQIGAPGVPTVVVGAHYDSVPRSPGANDNGSGIACLLTLVETICRDQVGTNWRPLEVCFWDMEEVGKRGSEFDARRRSIELTGAAEASLTIVLDMIGNRNPRLFSQRLPIGVALWSPTLAIRWLVGAGRGDFHLIVGRRNDLQTLANLGVNLSGAWRIEAPSDVRRAGAMGLTDSDHASFWLSGRSAVLVTDTGPLRSSDYHTARDKWATVDIDFGVSVFNWLCKVASC